MSDGGSSAGSSAPGSAPGTRDPSKDGAVAVEEEHGDIPGPDMPFAPFGGGGLDGLDGDGGSHGSGELDPSMNEELRDALDPQGGLTGPALFTDPCYASRDYKIAQQQIARDRVEGEMLADAKAKKFKQKPNTKPLKEKKQPVEILAPPDDGGDTLLPYMFKTVIAKVAP